MSSLDPRIVESLRSAYDQRTSRGELLSTDRLQASYAAFRVRFGPDALRSLDGPALLQVMHAHGNRESLVYWLEFKNDDGSQGRCSAASPAAVRMLFDWLVVGQVLATNPAHAVRGPKHVVKRGKTPVLTAKQARELLDSIDVSTLVGLRDRALIAVMTYALARVGAVVSMRVEDYYPLDKRWWVRLHEKGGKRHEMPAHHNLEAYLDAYINAAGIREEKKTPLFRSAAGRTGTLTSTVMNRVDAWRMVQRRAAELGMKGRIGCHTFRATGITAYLEGGGTLENAQAMAAHESPRTTKLYDRTGDEITLDEVERIGI
jgi:site-specific recombinase XerC